MVAEKTDDPRRKNKTQKKKNGAMWQIYAMSPTETDQHHSG
jgi:hypothetical protein